MCVCMNVYVCLCLCVCVCVCVCVCEQVLITRIVAVMSLNLVDIFFLNPPFRHSTPLPLFKVWAGPLSGGDIAVIALNADNSGTANITVNWTDLGVFPSRRFTVQDLFAGTSLGLQSVSVTVAVPFHDVVALRLTPQP